MEKKLSYTQVQHFNGLKIKLELEDLMKSDNWSSYWRQEITMVYFINNLTLIQTKN